MELTKGVIPAKAASRDVLALRKTHCTECLEPIKPLTVYLRVKTELEDGEKNVFRFCNNCQNLMNVMFQDHYCRGAIFHDLVKCLAKCTCVEPEKILRLNEHSKEIVLNILEENEGRKKQAELKQEIQR